MSEIYRLAQQEDAERLQYVTYEAYETIRQLELKWPAAQADIPLIQENIKNNDCWCWSSVYGYHRRRYESIVYIRIQKEIQDG
ncbi:hypothetical protein [Paenibacillus maysiensis]|uniref:hypothetical protein n=1 Tax=Paenibacillus maysiensis TaxID=1155954 RepID=UPI00047245A2|nr:hypothetical protein [Paenibacillus maysiensis]